MKLANIAECTACMSCVDSCGRNAISICVDEYGYYRIVTNSHLCVNCGTCSKVCPVLQKKTRIHGGAVANVAFACWSEDKVLRGIAASGGAFVALASEVLRRGGIVYGASIDGFIIRHIRVTNVHELPKIAGSKYQQSEMIGIYKLIKNDLRNGALVLFGGLSCQVAALKLFVGESYLDNLLTVDTICGGLSTMSPMLALKEQNRYKSVYSFRDKLNGWKSVGFEYSLKMLRDDNSIENLGLNNLVMKSFCSTILKRSSCLDCEFNGYKRVSDCTIGDYWGDVEHKDEHFNGLSILITHTNRLNDIINNSSLHIEPANLSSIISNNNSFFWSHYPFLRKCSMRKRLLNSLKAKDMNEAERQLENPSFWERLELWIYYRFNSLQKSLFLKRESL